MTAEFGKNFYKKTRGRKRESIPKISNWVETDASAQSPF